MLIHISKYSNKFLRLFNNTSKLKRTNKTKRTNKINKRFNILVAFSSNSFKDKDKDKDKKQRLKLKMIAVFNSLFNLIPSKNTQI